MASLLWVLYAVITVIKFLSTAEALSCQISLTRWVAGWVGDSLSNRFFFYKRHEFQTLHANSMWWEVNARLIFFLNFLYFPENTRNSTFFVNAISHNL